MNRTALSLGLGLAGATLIACGDEMPVMPDAPVVECTTPRAERYLPFDVGSTWTYDVTEVGLPTVQKTSTVEAFEDTGGDKAGVEAFRVRTEKTAGATVSWQQDICTGVVRHREKSFDMNDALVSDQYYAPSKLRIDETPARLAQSATWTESYTETEIDPGTGATTTTAKAATWTVDAVDEEITVPAGTFTCLRLHRVGADVGQSDKTYWFAAGVGKIRETGSQTEELASYTLAAELR